MIDNKFVITTALKKLIRLKKRIKVVQGGTSASKTFSILPILIDKAIKTKGLEISVVGESLPSLRRGAIKDFLKIMHLTNRYIDENWSKSVSKYTFSNGSYIEFFGVDQPDKLRGARRNILFVNECNNVSFEAYIQLSIRTSEEIWLDYNPTHKFWVHTEIIDDKDAELITLTYKDNEALSESIIRELEKKREKAKTSKYWQNWWNVYGLGQLGRLEGVILQDWSRIDFVPDDAKYIGSGLDFGYTNDTTTLIDVWYCNGEYIFDEVIYQTGLRNTQIAKLSKEITKTVLDAQGKEKEIKIKRIIYADSAEPKSIDEIYLGGVAIYGARKGADSIRFGLQLLQKNHFRVTKKSVNLTKELDNYLWKVDKEGNTTNEPIDIYNHCIDAMRYFAMEVFGRGGKMDIR